MDVAHDAAGYLLQGVTVDLVGRAGAGRTQVLRQVADLLATDGRQVVRLSGVRALRGRSLGAVVEHRGGRRPDQGGAAGGPLAALNRDLRPGAVVLLDDADDTDAATTGALAALHTRAGVPMLLTRRPPAEPRGVVRDLATTLQPGVRLELPPLRFDEVHQIVHDLLGAAVDPLTVARITTKSGGLPRLVRALVLVGTSTGALQQVDGLWTAVRPLWSPELAHTLEGLLLPVRRRDVEALALLASERLTDLEAAGRALPAGQLAVLRRAGLLDVRPTSDGPRLSISPPLLGEYLAHAALSRSGPAPVPSAPGGARANAADAAVLSRIIGDHWSSRIEAHRTRWTADPALAHALPLVQAILAAGAPADVDAVIERTRPDAGTPQERAELAAWQAVHAALSRGEPGAAAGTLRDAADTLPVMRGYLDAVDHHLTLVLDRVPDPVPVPADAPPGLDLDARLGVNTEIALARGTPAAALEILAGHTASDPTFVRHQHVARGLALVLAGDLEPGTASALRQLGDAQRDRDPGGILAHTYVAGLGLAISGRLGELDALLSSTLTITTVSVLQEYFHAGILALAAQAAVWQGRTSYAATLDEQARAVRHPSGPYPQMDTQPAAGPDAPGEAWALVRGRLERGYVAWGVFAAVETAERALGPLPGGPLRDLVPRTDGPLLDALVRYADALAARDLAGIGDAGAAFRALGAHLYEARAAVASALIHREDGNTPAATREVERAWAVVAGFGIRADGLFRPYLDAVDLSAREIQVVELIATGLGTGDVATALKLSLRTVENHVFNVYRKLGIESRDDLRRATTTWLLPLASPGSGPS